MPQIIVIPLIFLNDDLPCGHASINRTARPSHVRVDFKKVLVQNILSRILGLNVGSGIIAGIENDVEFAVYDQNIIQTVE
jgi:hypothetical protein